MEQFDLHDIRHAGLITPAQVGATTRELTQPPGHRSTTVVLTDQHAGWQRGGSSRLAGMPLGRHHPTVLMALGWHERPQ
jgi:hypothetical protein